MEWGGGGAVRLISKRGESESVAVADCVHKRMKRFNYHALKLSQNGSKELGRIRISYFET